MWMAEENEAVFYQIPLHLPPLVGTQDPTDIYNKIPRNYAKNSSYPRPI